jgi:hypothetical protein
MKETVKNEIKNDALVFTVSFIISAAISIVNEYIKDKK